MSTGSLCQGKIIIDLEAATVTHQNAGNETTHPIGSDAGFSLVSDAWLRAGWDAKYVYSFSWFGRPVIQLPEDMIRIQEIFWQIQPDVIIETGVAHGGGQVFFASLCKALGRGRVIGVELELRPQNRAAIKAHMFSDLITLVDGSSTAAETLTHVRAQVKAGEKTLIVLDSNHSKAHVLAELEAYGPMVSPGSYIVACDGIAGRVASAPRSQPDWNTNNPMEAVKEFLASHPEFELATPVPPFNEGAVTTPVTYWPSAYLKRVK